MLPLGLGPIYKISLLISTCASPYRLAAWCTVTHPHDHGIQSQPPGVDHLTSDGRTGGLSLDSPALFLRSLAL